MISFVCWIFCKRLWQKALFHFLVLVRLVHLIVTTNTTCLKKYMHMVEKQAEENLRRVFVGPNRKPRILQPIACCAALPSDTRLQVLLPDSQSLQAACTISAIHSGQRKRKLSRAAKPWILKPKEVVPSESEKCPAMFLTSALKWSVHSAEKNWNNSHTTQQRTQFHGICRESAPRHKLLWLKCLHCPVLTPYISLLSSWNSLRICGKWEGCVQTKQIDRISFNSMFAHFLGNVPPPQKKSVVNSKLWFFGVSLCWCICCWAKGNFFQTAWKRSNRKKSGEKSWMLRPAWFATGSH